MTNLTIQVNQIVDDLVTHAISESTKMTIVLVLIVVSVLTTGTYTLLLTRVTWRTTAMCFSTMIILDSLERLLGVILIDFQLFVAMSNTSLREAVGKEGCKVLFYLTTTTGGFHSFIGGFGLALMRLLYIKHPNWLQTLGPGRATWFIVISG